jgi:hypothetical protein
MGIILFAPDELMGGSDNVVEVVKSGEILIKNRASYYILAVPLYLI